MAEKAQQRSVPSPKGGVCLCILFNHPYLRNIPLLRRIYQDRFSTIRFLVPLHRTDEPDVITVYRGSFAHHAYAVDAWPELKTVECSHFVFVHDDVLLAPALNERTILDDLKIKGDRDGYIALLTPPPKDIGEWGHLAGPLWRLLYPRNVLAGTGVDSLATVLEQLPDADAAYAKLKQYGASRETTLVRTTLSDDHQGGFGHFTFFGHQQPKKEARFATDFLDLLFSAPPGQGSVTIPYPILICGPTADFYVAPRACMDEFLHIAGVLAAAGLFVEIAAAMALALACDCVSTIKQAPYTCIWGRASMSSQAILEQMRSDPLLLLAHPVKLSAVTDEAAYLDEIHRMASLPFGFGAGGVEGYIKSLEPEFDPNLYLEANPDMRITGLSPWHHYLIYGRAEGRLLAPRADIAQRG